MQYKCIFLSQNFSSKSCQRIKNNYFKDKRKNIEGNKYEQKTHTTKSLANDNKKRLEKL
jgi:hypothetical protein